MHEGREPDFGPMWTTKFFSPYQTMQASIVVTAFSTSDESPQAILLDPINLEISEWFPIKAANDWKQVLVIEDLRQIPFLNFSGSLQSEHLRDS